MYTQRSTVVQCEAMLAFGVATELGFNAVRFAIGSGQSEIQMEKSGLYLKFNKAPRCLVYAGYITAQQILICDI